MKRSIPGDGRLPQALCLIAILILAAACSPAITLATATTPTSQAAPPPAAGVAPPLIPEPFSSATFNENEPPVPPPQEPAEAQGSPPKGSIRSIETPDTANAAQAAPEIYIVSPEDGSDLAAGNIKIKVKVSNFKLVDKVNGANAGGEGHLQYFMDVEPPTTPGQPAVTAKGTYFPTYSNIYIWPGVKPGEHTFYVQLVNNDHTPLNPPIVTQINLVVHPADHHRSLHGH